MQAKISVVIPACEAEKHLGHCLRALHESLLPAFEIIVVDDASRDATGKIAADFGVKVLHTDQRMGPAFARNLGAKAAAGDVLFFVDSDVCVRPDTLKKIGKRFDEDAALDAIIGSYDENPAEQDFISQYRNLMHAYIHQTGAERASTFWSGCGAIRREIFLEHSGFSEEYGRPSIEDIELGYRLTRDHRKIVLDRSIQVTHLKKWTFWNLVKTDIMDRGIPWTELILRDRTMPNDLNLQISQRVSVALVFVLVALSGALAVVSGAYLLVPLLAILFLMLARWWGELGSYRRPHRALFILSCAVGLIAAVAYSYRMFGLIPPLTVVPVLLALRHRYNKQGTLKKSHRWLGIVYICCSLCIALYYLPAHKLIFACFAVLLLLALLNSQFYIFLAGKRGIAFMLAAIPFHLLYHFYNGLSFVVGISRHFYAAAVRGGPPGAAEPPPGRKQYPLSR
ncbi:MAG: glycosyltransferase family 2 protein [Terracidiphilus sp.]|jgi:glycosyltransferase involved in cell wall biosynthesis